MGIPPYGTDAYLRYMLRKRLQWYIIVTIFNTVGMLAVLTFTIYVIFVCRIKNDDMMIQKEGGVDALSEDELREDCRERGMLGLRSVEEMRQQVFFKYNLIKQLYLIVWQ